MQSESIQPVKQSHVRHYLVVATCVIMCFAPSALTFSCSGIFYVPVTQFLDIPMTAFAVTMTIAGIAAMLALPLGGKLMDRYDVRVVLTIAVVCVGGGLVWRSFANSLWEWYVSAAFLGIGVAITLYLATPVLIGRWFEKRIGTFVGLSMAFTGIGGVVFNMIGGVLIAGSPEGWRMAYLVFGLSCLIISLPFTLFAIRNSPAEVGLVPYNTAGKKDKIQHAAPTVLSGVPGKKAMRLGVFYVTAIFAACITLVSVVLNYWPSYVSSFAEVYPATAAAATWIASVTMLGAVVGKILLGALCDKNVYYGLFTGLLFGAIGVVLLGFFPQLVPCIAAGAFCFGICFAAATVQLPQMVRFIFGSLDYTTIYSRISMVSALASSVGAMLWGGIVDGPGFSVLLIVCFGFIVVCLVTGVLAINGKKKMIFETDNKINLNGKKEKLEAGQREKIAENV